MCGIAGILSKDRFDASSHRLQRMRAMLSAMEHRGPDGNAEFASDRIAIAANRLAIRGVDQVQPPLFVDPSGVVVACNGEIDNHLALRKLLQACGRKVEPGSDIAVIAPLYLEKGMQFLDELDGVFALALWDPRKNRLILARDRVGERHLYYATAGADIYFASELAALQQALPQAAGSDPQLDRQSLALFLRSGYCPSPWTLLPNHFKVSPGETIVWEGNRTRYMRYWTPPLGARPARTPSTSSFDKTFKEAIRRQTDVDVDFGVLLSGGLDSSLITAVTRDVHPNKQLNAYCVRFEESSFDEGRNAEEVARQYGCSLNSVTMRAHDVPRTLSHLIRTTGEALADPAWLPQFLVTEHAARNVKMLLSGEGADELFGGYPTYIGTGVSAFYAKLSRPLQALVRGIVHALPVSDKKVSVSFLLKRFVDGQGMDGLARHLLWNSPFSPDWIHRLGVDYPARHEGYADLDLLSAVQRYDFEHALPDALMAKADRGGMCNGLEVRAPFLDRHVVEYAATLPTNSRVDGLKTKTFLKQYAAAYLPDSVIHQRKRGLSLPLAQWLRGPLTDWAHEKISSESLQSVGICTTSAMDLMREHVARKQDHSRGLWHLIVLSEWIDWLMSHQSHHVSEAMPHDLLHDVVAYPTNAMARG